MRGATAALTLAGCAVMPRAVPVPMRRLEDRSGCTAATGVVLLPGAYSPPEEFVDEGFIAALRRRRLAVDVVAADSHLGYFIEGQSVPRLRADIVGPARGAGAPLWLVGISLGGFVALQYAARHPDDVAGLVLLAPYPGRPPFLADVEAAGGVEAWAAGRGARPAPAGDGADPEAEVWSWLVQRRDRLRRGLPVTPVSLGYGTEDRFARHLGWMDMLLEPAPGETNRPTQAIRGGHDWKTWLALWESWLERGLLPDTCR